MIIRQNPRQRTLFLFQIERAERNSSAWRQALEAQILTTLGKEKNTKDAEWNAIWNEVIVSQTERSLQISAKTPTVNKWLEKHTRALFHSVSKIQGAATPVDDMSLDVGVESPSSTDKVSKGGRMRRVIPTLVVRTPKNGDKALWEADSAQSPDETTINRWTQMIKEDILNWHLGFNPLELNEGEDAKHVTDAILESLDLKIESAGKAMPLKGAVHKADGRHITPLARLKVVICTRQAIRNMHVGKLQGLGFGRIQSEMSHISQRLEFPMVSKSSLTETATA